MALDATHWTVSDTVEGDIRYTGPAHGVASASYVTTIELHRWLQDLADDASASGDDILDITDSTPSERNGTDNNITLYDPYNIDQTASEHIYDGSITQGEIGVDRKIWDGFVNYGNEGINIQVLQNGAYISNDFWNQTPSGESESGLNRLLIAGISHRFMVLVHDFAVDGGDIDGRRVIGMSRELGKSYSEFKSTTVRGNNTLALVNATDGNNSTDKVTIEGWTIANTEGYRSIDVDIDGSAEHYYSEWDRGTQSINDLYEYVKMLTAYDRVGTIYGIDGKIFRGVTHEIPIDNPSVTDFSVVEAISWGTGATAGTGQMLAIDDIDAGTVMWMQLLTGVIPTDGLAITGGTSGATADVNGSCSERTVSPIIVGLSTGSAIDGAYGFGVEALDLSASDKVTSLDDPATKITPPDYKDTKIGGIIDGDRVLVGPDTGSTALMDNQLAVSTTITSGATSVIMKSSTETIGTGTQFATDCPGGGGTIKALRILGDDGVYWRIPYSVVVHGSGIATFTVLGADTTGLAAAVDNDGFMGYIDAAESGADEEIKFTTVFHSARALFVRVRDGGASPIKTFETATNVGGSVTAIRSED